MSAWVKKRFWTDTSVVPAEGGFTVHLDGRGLRTPLKAPVTVPTEAAAALIAAEWEAQTGKIDPETMPATRAANAAIDKVTGQQAEVTEMIAAYGDSDLICYRAAAPQELVARESAAWDPLVDWAAVTFGARLTVQAGVMHVPQPPEALRALSAPLHQMSAFELTAFHDLVSMSGSLVIGLASIMELAPTDTLWALSRIDEDWQTELWGSDDEAENLARLRKSSFVNANRFYDAVRTGTRTLR
ncbi:ATP12 family chaperone protein [Roseicitreum antarcticum]|uniref:Chaperone required for the assembly of the F1-ATPase n=1 Tax=Roseicitreum antarcticum TaxID=564137 RepID=A0A1H3AQX8_9RHOB|nr:ATP12 family protein [Roseicitreum antarcticum]SDX32077.1 Chaperone required for the assembly of the F1-ATPase [Roseicitreum antarcticum]